MKSINKWLITNQKRIYYTICFMLLCVIDQRKGSVTGNMQNFWSNCTGLVIALLILSHYHIKDFFKKPYAIWTVISVLSIPLSGYLLQDYIGVGRQWDTVQWYSALANIIIFGFLIIRTIIAHKNNPWTKKRLFLPGLLCAMLLLMGLSYNDSIWPWYFLMVFGTFSLTDFTEKERTELSSALVDGIILGFFCIQGLGFVIRPYDQIRYLGMYSNPNINALFYSIVYAAFLAKFCYFYNEYNKEFKWLLRFISLFFCGAMWSFVLLTGCRSALLSMAVITAIAGIYCLYRSRKHIILQGIGMIAGLILCLCASFPIVFGCVRYLPALFHHPVWFHAEYNENKVHSWDPIDSEKYIDFDEFLGYTLERLLGIELPTSDMSQNYSIHYDYMVSADTTGLPGSSFENPLSKDASDSGTFRALIYDYYLSNLNIRGHLNSDNGVYVSSGYYAPHAHNIFLQMLFDFGFPIGCLFIVYTIFCSMKSIKNLFTKYSIPICFFFINVLVFGMMELAWINGYLAFTLLFLTPFFDTEMG